MKLKLAVFGLAALGGIALATGSASAMPNGLAQAGAIAGETANVDQVRHVCDRWGRCHWRPNYYRSYGYSPRYRHSYGFYRHGPRHHGYHHHHRFRW